MESWESVIESSARALQKVNDIATKTDITPLDWEKLFHFIEYCGRMHDPYCFAEEIINGLKDFCHFDSAVAMFLNCSRNIVGNCLWNTDPKWFKTYVEYYSKQNLEAFDLRRDVEEKESEPYVMLLDWREHKKMDFVQEYLLDTGIIWSQAFVLFDMNGMPRTTFSLDYLKDNPPTETSFRILRTLVPALNNLHKNFFVTAPDNPRPGEDQIAYSKLTEREKEIIGLICQGVSPANIAKILHIAVSTAYKHIANIYKKLNVSSRQELLVRMLHQS